MYCQSNNWWRFRRILWHSQNRYMNFKNGQDITFAIGLLGILNLLDYMIIFLELLFVDYGMEINVFVSNPLFGGYRQYIVPSDHLQSHSGNVVDSKFYIRHFCKEKSLSMID